MTQANPEIRTIDLLKIEGSGDFPCPNCGTVISPDDQSEKTYEIVETKVSGDSLEELLIQCRCGCRIRLTGFIPNE